MANVPLLSPQGDIPVERAPVPDLTRQPMGPGINAAPIFEQAAGTGKEISGMAAQLEQHLVYQARLNSNMDAYDREAAAQKFLQDRIDGPGGFRTRMGQNAIGITSGVMGADKAPQGYPGTTIPGDGIKFEDSFEGIAATAKANALKGVNPFEAKTITRRLDSMIGSLRGTVYNHEVTQTALAQQASHENAINTGISTLSIAQNADDFKKGLPAIDSNISEFHGARGMPQDVIDSAIQSAHDKAAMSWVQQNIQRVGGNGALSFVNGIKDAISKPGYAALTGDNSPIRGKLIEENADHQLALSPKTGDGAPDMMAFEKVIRKEDGYSADEKEKMIERGHQMYNVAMSAMRDTNNGLDTTFNSGINKMVKEKQPIDKMNAFATAQARVQFNGQKDQSSIAANLKYVQDLMDPAKSRNAKLEHTVNMMKDGPEALALADSQFDATFGKKYLQMQDGDKFVPSELAKKQLRDGIVSERIKSASDINTYVQTAIKSQPKPGSYGWTTSLGIERKQLGVQAQAQQQKDSETMIRVVDGKGKPGKMSMADFKQSQIDKAGYSLVK